MLSPTVQVLIASTISFMIGIGLTPILTHYLYKHRAWKKTPGKVALDGCPAEEFNRLHQQNEVRAPRMGGIVIWASVFLTTMGFALIAQWSDAFRPLNFLSRSETWLPFAGLMTGAICGLVDDLLVIRPGGRGLPLSVRLIIVFALSLFAGWWFWDKLAVHAVSLPFFGTLEVGPFIIPLFVLVSLALYASGVIDGIDGLSGGIFASIFASYTLIAFAEQQTNLAAFCAAVVGGLLAFLWFNIPPARFYMSDTGTMALTLSLSVVVFMTDTLGNGIGVAVLPVIGGLLVITVLSDIAQLLSKAIFHKKILRIAPLHHHFEAIGWPGTKVVMRYWVLSIVCAFAGVVIALAAK
jgi:phospho-N-acetylmuramoyl-pentapeptide-transferase